MMKRRERKECERTQQPDGLVKTNQIRPDLIKMIYP